MKKMIAALLVICIAVSATGCQKTTDDPYEHTSTVIEEEGQMNINDPNEPMEAVERVPVEWEDISIAQWVGRRFDIPPDMVTHGHLHAIDFIRIDLAVSDPLAVERFLQSLPNLRGVELDNASDVIPVRNLTNLERLVLFDIRRPRESGNVDLSSLTYLENLQELTLRFNGRREGGTIENIDFSSLSNLENLQELRLEFLRNIEVCAFDLSPIAGLTEMRDFRFEFPGSRARTFEFDLAPLSNLTNLESVQITSPSVRPLCLRPFENLTSLRTLYIRAGYVPTLDGLQGCTNLEELTVSALTEDISALQSLANLRRLNIGGGLLSDLQPLANLTNLETLTLLSSEITDISPLASLTNLTELTLTRNNISDISALSTMAELRRLRISSNPITSFDALSNNRQLEYLEIDAFEVKSLEPLHGLLNLTELYINGSSHITPEQFIAMIDTLPSLGWFDASSNARPGDISWFTERYSPRIQFGHRAFDASRRFNEVIPFFENQSTETSELVILRQLQYLM